MHYLALATDYDDTIADGGRMDDRTVAALEKLRQRGWRLLLVTGRILWDLQQVCPRLDLFHLVVAENGALLYQPDSNLERCLGKQPPQQFLYRLQQLGVDHAMGRVIVATRRPHEHEIGAVIAELELDLRIIFNKQAVMVLPGGVDKRSGLLAALEKLRILPQQTVGVGDAENDSDFLAVCGLQVAVANALPELKVRVDRVTAAERGAGVEELVDQLLAER